MKLVLWKQWRELIIRWCRIGCADDLAHHEKSPAHRVWSKNH